jgi:hypothetical protein
MRDWAKACAQQAAVWLSKILDSSFWFPLLAGVIIGSVAAARLSPTDTIVTGWPGLCIGALLGAIVAFALETVRDVVDQVRSRKPLNKHTIENKSRRICTLTGRVCIDPV